MAITTQAQFFLNAYRILERNEAALQAEQKRRAQRQNLDHSDSPSVDQVCYATDEHIGVSDFVCLAFSVELFVKAVFEALGRRQRGHNIRELFEKLPPDVQTKIAEIHMRNIYHWTLDDYKDQMDVISKGFEEFRYSHEHKELFYHKGFALKMIDAVRQVIDDIRAQKQ
ncbi:HEPN domain-containing protein [Hoeflea poritis]|uniref:HEPN domain-containing protein n=1 Tax=Hoeflea poritis TaxID=2993659 RepID=A0ABT4VL67_9HYPH|nr:HEPN domain-containing protein [Hoeflea poritis]MDA4845461.1 HEPN domain-containing protein [Hoeflea poritis]